jgi:hypothetical protein
MKIKKAIKKIFVLCAGVSMLGATLAGAAASPYYLSDYPTPFVEDGNFNGILVVGDDASPVDIIGVVDIATSLQHSATIKEDIKISRQTGLLAAGDSIKPEVSGDVLEINEYLGDVTETLDADDALALSRFTVANNKGSTDVNQYLRFAWGPGTVPTDASYAKVIYAKDDEGNVGDFLWFKEGEEAFQYELEFVQGLESGFSADDSAILEDLEGETLRILGEDFTILRARWLPVTKGLVLTLLGGNIHDHIEEGESKTYSLKGSEYEVTALIVSDSPGSPADTEVKLIINGMVTKHLTKGSTETLPDGTTLGIANVLPNEAGERTGGDMIELYIGATKLELRDRYAADTWDGNVEVNGDNIEDSDLLIYYTNTSDSVKIHKISYRLFTEGIRGEEPYIAPGQGYRDKIDEPEGMLARNWDFRYEGIADPGAIEMQIKSRGDDEYRLSFVTTQGIPYNNIKYLYTNSSGTLTFGDEDDNFVFQAPALTEVNSSEVAAKCLIKKEDSFLVSHNAISRILRFESVDTDNNILQLTDLGTGGSIDAFYTAMNHTTTGDVINVGGHSFNFVIWNGFGSDKEEYLLCVDLDDDNSLATAHEAYVVIGSGGITDLFNGTVSSYRPDVEAVRLTLATKSKYIDEAPYAYEMIYVDLTVSDSRAELDLEPVDSPSIGLTFNSPEDNDDLSSGMTQYGVLISEINEDNDPDSLTIRYPHAQRLPQTFVTFEENFVVDSSIGTITVETPKRIGIGAAMLASQIPKIDAGNIISVGGPCVNAVTAELMGLEYPACRDDSGLREGEGIIRLYENGENVAIVVAGWEAEDTTRATRVLADYKRHIANEQLVGSKVKVTGTSVSHFTVTPLY